MSRKSLKVMVYEGIEDTILAEVAEIERGLDQVTKRLNL